MLELKYRENKIRIMEFIKRRGIRILKKVSSFLNFFLKKIEILAFNPNFFFLNKIFLIKKIYTGPF